MILNQYENYTSITSPIYRINSQNNNTNTFENIVIIENFDDNSKQAFLITYNPSSDYIQSVTTNSLPAYKGEIAIQNLDYNSVDISSRVTCITYTQAICRNNGCPAGPGSFDNRDGGEHIIYETSIVCFSVNDVPVFVDMNESGTGGGESSTIYGSNSGTNNLNNTIVTEPVVTQNRTEQKLLQSFTTLEQSNWWLFVASDDTKDDIINYLNQNTINNVVEPQAEQFLLELIDFYIDENIIGEDDLKNKIRQAIANGITSTAEFTHKIFKKFSNLAEQYPSSITYINSILETINDAAATVTNTNPSTCTFADLFNMWLFELGPNPITINGSNATSTIPLKAQEGVNQARNIALSKIQNGDFSITNHTWTYGQGEFYDGMSNGNFVTAFLGSYSTKVTISSTTNGFQLNFQVTNTSSWDSATRFRIDNDNNGVHDGIFPNTDRENSNDLSMGGNFTQNWYWLEPLN